MSSNISESLLDDAEYQRVDDVKVGTCGAGYFSTTVRIIALVVIVLIVYIYYSSRYASCDEDPPLTKIFTSAYDMLSTSYMSVYNTLHGTDHVV